MQNFRIIYLSDLYFLAKIFLSSEIILDNFCKLLLYSNQVSHSTSLCVEFHDCQPNSLRGKESQKSRSEQVKALLAILNNKNILELFYLL